MPVPADAFCCRSRTRTGWRISVVGLWRGAGLASTGGTARALREAGLPVTDVAVTGFPEDARRPDQDAHRRGPWWLLADRRRADHREALLAAGIAPFDLVVVNLTPSRRPPAHPGSPSTTSWRRSTSAGRPWSAPPRRTTPRWRSSPRPLATGPSLRPSTTMARSRSVCVRAGRAGIPTPPPTTRGIADGLAGAQHGRRGRGAPPAEPGLPGSDDPYPPVLTISMEKVDTLRYGPHQPAARYRRHGDREPRAADGPFAGGEPPLQGKALSYNNVLDASAAAALARRCAARRS